MRAEPLIEVEFVSSLKISVPEIYSQLLVPQYFACKPLRLNILHRSGRYATRN
jgi:hypothetical protein